MLCVFPELSQYLRFTSVGAKQAPQALSTAKFSCKHGL